jgi:hypothetical protein
MIARKICQIVGHPQTQSKIKRRHKKLKNRTLLADIARLACKELSPLILVFVF